MSDVVPRGNKGCPNPKGFGVSLSFLPWGTASQQESPVTGTRSPLVLTCPHLPIAGVLKGELKLVSPISMGCGLAAWLLNHLHPTKSVHKSTRI